MIEFLLSRLYNAAVRYYLLKEIGEPALAVKAAEIRSEMFAALLEAHLRHIAPVEGKWYDVGQIHFDLEKGVFRYVPSGGDDEDS